MNTEPSKKRARDTADDAKDNAKEEELRDDDGKIWCPIQRTFRAAYTDWEHFQLNGAERIINEEIPAALRARAKEAKRNHALAYCEYASLLARRAAGEAIYYTEDAPFRAFWKKLLNEIFRAIAQEAAKEQAADAKDEGEATPMTTVLNSARQVIDYDTIRSPKDAFDAAYESGAIQRPDGQDAPAENKHFDVEKAYWKVFNEELKQAGQDAEWPLEEAPMFGMFSAWTSHKLPDDLLREALQLVPSVLIDYRIKPIDKADCMLNSLCLDPPAYAGDSLGFWHEAMREHVYGRGPNPDL